ncbi:cuticle protein 19.8-like [Adelges cooleyi]|uniref:cuticle protein 19.8-like n=1 Tax=Adelges cooleyi TaxID=133065 RepID=UPI0021804867|nr:cuticle protein 19.8-like [Adelges cooleyi]
MKIFVQLIVSIIVLWTSVTNCQDFYVPAGEENELTYEFNYEINDLVSGIVSHRWESRYGDYVKGSYSFLEPNGMIRSVFYEVDGNKGYRAITKIYKPTQMLKLSTSEIPRPNDDNRLV